MSVRTFFQQSIVSLPCKTWLILSKLSIIFLFISLLVFILFYRLIYIPNLSEESFIDRINCTISDIINNNQSCNKQKQKVCQLIIGECFIFDHIQNITLYSTRLDYETSSDRCTINPCFNSDQENFQQNQSFLSIYWSSHLKRGYLKVISKFDVKTGRVLVYLLISIIILTCICSIILISIVHVYDKYETIIRAPTIVIQKASKLTQDECNQIHTNVTSINSTPLSLPRLAVPLEATLSEEIRFRSFQSLNGKAFEPLNTVVPLRRISTSGCNNHIIVMQNIITEI